MSEEKRTGEAVVSTAENPEAVPTVVPKASDRTKPKQVKAKSAGMGAGALKAVGLSACKRHNLAHVWVTSDGQSFIHENDATQHAKNLTNKETIKVIAK